MILTNAIKVTGKYTGKSKFDFLKNLMPDDVITFSLEIKSNHGYAATVLLFNKRTKEKMYMYCAEFDKYMSKIPHIDAKEIYTREEVIDLLQDVYMETAGSHNDYGKDAYDYREDAIKEIDVYMSTR